MPIGLRQNLADSLMTIFAYCASCGLFYGRKLALWLISDSWLFCRDVTTAWDEQTWDEQTWDEQMWDEPFTWQLTGFSSSPPRSDLHKKNCGTCLSNNADIQLKII
jgi:hypothetical protein